eukprot:2558333-Rhodomonas_salina.1
MIFYSVDPVFTNFPRKKKGTGAVKQRYPSTGRNSWENLPRYPPYPVPAGTRVQRSLYLRHPSTRSRYRRTRGTRGFGSRGSPGTGALATGYPGTTQS